MKSIDALYNWFINAPLSEVASVVVLVLFIACIPQFFIKDKEEDK